jgi:arginine deiminase
VDLSEAIRAAPPPVAALGRAQDQRVDSEVGRLRSVLLHRPGSELSVIDEANAARMLFAEPVEVAQAQAQHDAFAATLRAQGAEIVYVEELLTELAADEHRRDRLLSMAMGGVSQAVRRQVAMLAPRRIARALIGGLRSSELAVADADRGDTWLLPPVPNLLFTRDPSTWIGATAMVGRMAANVRRGESTLVQALYELHPRFAHLKPAPPAAEGGDLLVAAPERLVVGISPRTSASRAHRLASTLVGRTAVTEVLTVQMPSGSGFHLDLVLGMVDRETFTVWAPARRTLRAHRWRATASGVSVCAVADPFSWLSGSGRVIEVGSPATERHGRAWDHGVNVLAVAPGVVVAYGDNDRANRQLAAAGIEVIAISGSALASGRGGPRCLSCPLSRDPIDGK